MVEAAHHRPGIIILKSLRGDFGHHPAQPARIVLVENQVMRIEQIHVENLKCSGCAATISKALMEMDGVELVNVDKDRAVVEAEVQDRVRRQDMTEKLGRLGYPELGTGNLLQKGISYVSCMIGKVSKEKEAS